MPGGMFKLRFDWYIISENFNLITGVNAHCDRQSVHKNRPFPSSLVPPFHNESKCETFRMKMSSACSFIFMQIKVIFIGMVSHLDSL